MKITNPSKFDLAATKADLLKQDSQVDNLAAPNTDIRKVSEEFEAIFLELVLKSMRSTIQKSDLFGGGNGEDVFRSLLDGEYAKTMASQHTSGIADALEKQLTSWLPDKDSKLNAIRGHSVYKSQTLGAEDLPTSTIKERK